MTEFPSTGAPPDPVTDDVMIPIGKSEGPTSRRVLDRVGRRLGRRDLGHAGTLDPFASGLLLLLAGRATKLVPWVHEWDKEYEAVIRLGVATDTLDRTGTVVATEAVPRLSRAEIEEAALSLTGDVEQAPPMHSAVKSGGVRLYELARQGVLVERPVRTRSVSRFEVVDFATPDVHAVVTCSSGTYVRSLAEALGQRLGLPAHLETLVRKRIGPVTLDQAFPDSRLDDPEWELPARCTPMAGILDDWPVVPVTAEEAVFVGQGRIPGVFELRGRLFERFRVVGPSGRLVALVSRPSPETGFQYLRVLISPGDTC